MFLINYFIKGTPKNGEATEINGAGAGAQAQVDEQWEIVNPEEVLESPKKPSPSLVLSNNFTTSHFEEITPLLITATTQSKTMDMSLSLQSLESQPQSDFELEEIESQPLPQPQSNPQVEKRKEKSQASQASTSEATATAAIAHHQPKKHSRQLDLHQQLFPKNTANPSKRKRDIVTSNKSGPNANGAAGSKRSGKYKQSSGNSGRSNDRKTGSRGF